MHTKRLKEHRKNDRLETLLKEVNELLGPLESKAVASFDKCKYPLILIVGCARGGTTLLLQWLAGLGYFCYPSNMLSRFYGAPFIGAKIQLMLTRHDFKKEIFDFQKEVPFTSNLGKTTGALAPNEFWYFWRRFFKYGDIQYLNKQELQSIDCRQFIAELAAIEAVFDKPLAMKGMIINWNIPFISSILENVLFLHVKREPFYNMQSFLEARQNFFGDAKEWYSFKPVEYPELKDLDPFGQVAGQVFYTNRAIEEGLSSINASRRLEVRYEEFCANPEQAFRQIADKLALQGYEINKTYSGQKRFENTNKRRLSDDDSEKLKVAYKKFSGKENNL